MKEVFTRRWSGADWLAASLCPVGHPNFSTRRSTPIRGNLHESQDTWVFVGEDAVAAGN